MLFGELMVANGVREAIRVQLDESTKLKIQEVDDRVSWWNEDLESVNELPGLQVIFEHEFLPGLEP